MVFLQQLRLGFFDVSERDDDLLFFVDECVFEGLNLLGSGGVFFVVCFFSVFDFVLERAGFFLEFSELSLEAVLLDFEVFLERLGLEDEQLVLLLEVVFLVLRARDLLLRGGRPRQ